MLYNCIKTFFECEMFEEFVHRVCFASQLSYFFPVMTLSLVDTITYHDHEYLDIVEVQEPD